MNIFKQLAKVCFGERLRRARISRANREYRAVHGDCRRVPVYEMGQLVDFVYLKVNRRPGKLYKEIKAEQARARRLGRERYAGVFYG